ncbi:MAG TPA: hypothetical protein VMR95_02715 [Candidatus Binatia bacterium]|nr:hypothetical protein [Candidatus Binatia bacterium]
MENSQHNSIESQIVLLFKPSMLSGFFCTVIALFVTVGAMILAALKSNSFSQWIFVVRIARSTVDANYQAITTKLSHYQLTNDLVLLIFWMSVGAIVYVFLVNLVKSINVVASVERQMHYTNNRPINVLKYAGAHLMLRLLAIGLWFMLVTVLFHKLLPYDLASARTAVKYFSVEHGINVVLGTILLFIDLCLQTACLRLLLLRKRVIGVSY